MSPIAHISKAAWRCSCIACNLLNILLAFLAIGVGGIVVLNLFQKSVPVPDKLASWILNRSGPEYIQADWSKVVFDLRAGLYLSGFELRNSRTEQIMLTAEEAYIRWSPLHFLMPDILPIQEIDARGIEVYIPVSHSPSGLNEPVISVNHIFSYEDEGDLILESLLLETGGFRLNMSGRASIQNLIRSITPEDPAQSGKSRTDFYSLLQKLRRLPKNLKADIDADWEVLNSGSHVFRISGFLPEFDYRQVGLEKIFASAVLLYSRNQVVIREMNSHGILRYNGNLPDIPFLNIPDTPVPIPFRLSSGGGPLSFGENQIPSELHISLHPNDPDIKFQHLILRTSLNEQLNNPIDWILTGPAAFASGTAHPGATTGKIPLFSFPGLFEFRAYLPGSNIYQFLDAPLPHRLLVGTKADFVRLNGSFDVNKLHLQGSAVTDSLNIGQTKFDHLFTKLILNPQNLVLDNVHITKSQIEHAHGSYSQHFPSSRFSLNASGTIFPSSLDSILGDWWTDIFTDIQARQPLPGDVTVWGLWRDDNSLQSVTEVHGGGVRYRGVKIPQMELRVRSNANWAYLDRLRATFPDGQIEGTIGIQSGIGDTATHRAYVLDLTSTASWRTVLGATGLKSLEILEFIDANPHLRVKGTLWRDAGTGFDSAEIADLDLSLMQREGHCHLRTLDLTGISMNGHLRGNRLDLEGLSGQFAGGVFTGSIGITDWQNETAMHKELDIDLINADYRIAREQLSGFVGMDSEPMDGAQAEDLGRLDAELQLDFGEELESYSGTGNVAIHEGKIGTVHMFGELSRLLGGMGLGFTSIEMTTLSLDWNLAGPALEVKNGRVTGPALNLTLGGWVDLESQGLQMKSDVTLFSGLFSKVLAPVSDTLQFDLVGTLDAPEWKIRFNPFRWALNRMNDLSAPAGN